MALVLCGSQAKESSSEGKEETNKEISSTSEETTSYTMKLTLADSAMANSHHCFFLKVLLHWLL